MANFCQTPPEKVFGPQNLPKTASKEVFGCLGYVRFLGCTKVNIYHSSLRCSGRKFLHKCCRRSSLSTGTCGCFLAGCQLRWEKINKMENPRICNIYKYLYIYICDMAMIGILRKTCVSSFAVPTRRYSWIRITE